MNVRWPEWVQAVGQLTPANCIFLLSRGGWFILQGYEQRKRRLSG